MTFTMKHKINPQIDCVFKSILGSEANKSLLIDFLNSILQPEQTITSVTILNPYNEKEYLSDKLTIVDIKAEDQFKQLYQIEIQLANYAYLPQRILYTWSNIYSTQLKQGENYKQLAPLISIWLLPKDLFKDSTEHHHHFQLQDTKHRRLLSKDCSIHVLEFNKWQKQGTLNHADHWLYFFKEAYNWTSLPPELNTPPMHQAMETLQMYSEKELEYDRYLRRKLFIHDQVSQRSEIEDAKRELADIKIEAEDTKRKLVEAKKNTESTNEENKRLLALLKKSGIDPH